MANNKVEMNIRVHKLKEQNKNTVALANVFFPAAALSMTVSIMETEKGNLRCLWPSYKKSDGNYADHFNFGPEKIHNQRKGAYSKRILEEYKSKKEE